ncbi:MAG: histidinol dehydrogenase [Alphaproteobacteria bacterium]
MRRFIWADLSKTERVEALARPVGLSNEDLASRVKGIMNAVKNGGDKAVLDYTQQFDGATLNTLAVVQSDLKAAWEALPANQKQALELAKANIEAFHEAQKPSPIEVETMPGVMCRREPRPIEVAGLYVPGGTAPLVSTLLMLAVPAAIAGVSRRIVVTPPGKDGTINQAILAAAYLCSVTDVYACGGAQAVAAMAYGTESIPKCDKIFGPGNAYVATAKALAAQEPGGPAIDLPAGPSEAMVLADETANTTFVASDLLSQAEHDTLAQVICVCTNETVADSVIAEIDRQIATLPRKNIAEKSIASSRVFIANCRSDILDIVNAYAPEHLIIQLENPDSYVEGINHAGSMFLGPWTPESVGDYASGTNHTLPTYGAARAYSGVTLESFIKYISIQKLSREGLEALGPSVEILADMEQLEAHKRAVSIRLESK